MNNSHGAGTHYSEDIALFVTELQALSQGTSAKLLSPKNDELATYRTHLLRQFLKYDASPSRLTNSGQEIGYLFERFIRGLPNQRGLKLQFGSSSTLLLNELWISVDLAPLETASLGGMGVSLDFQDEQFDRVLCLDLDRVSQPARLVAEMRRVLKRGGQLWGQAPVDSYQQPTVGGGPRYWGFTPEGLRVLFERFDEIRCSVYQASGNVSRRDSFYYGIKPEIPSEAIGPLL